MPSKLFHALVVTGASLTGAVGIAVVPAVATLAGCDSRAEIGMGDKGVLVDAGLTLGTVDMSVVVTGIDAGPIETDGGDTDGGQ